jgi:hypothetical protein
MKRRLKCPFLVLGEARESKRRKIGTADE